MSEFGPYEPPTKGMELTDGGPDAPYAPEIDWQYYIKVGAKKVACMDLKYMTSYKALASLVAYGVAFRGKCPSGLDEIQDWHDQN